MKILTAYVNWNIQYTEHKTVYRKAIATRANYFTDFQITGCFYRAIILIPEISIWRIDDFGW